MDRVIIHVSGSSVSGDILQWFCCDSSLPLNPSECFEFLGSEPLCLWASPPPPCPCEGLFLSTPFCSHSEAPALSQRFSLHLLFCPAFFLDFWLCRSLMRCGAVPRLPRAGLPCWGVQAARGGACLVTILGSGAWAQGQQLLRCSVAGGIFLDQGSNLCVFLHWQADSLPLSHQGSPCFVQLLSSYYSLYILGGRIPLSEFPFTHGSLSHMVGWFGCFCSGGPAPFSSALVQVLTLQVWTLQLPACLPEWRTQSEGSALLISLGACSNKLI